MTWRGSAVKGKTKATRQKRRPRRRLLRARFGGRGRGEGGVTHSAFVTVLCKTDSCQPLHRTHIDIGVLSVRVSLDIHQKTPSKPHIPTAEACCEQRGVEGISPINLILTEEKDRIPKTSPFCLCRSLGARVCLSLDKTALRISAFSKTQDTGWTEAPVDNDGREGLNPVHW